MPLVMKIKPLRLASFKIGKRKRSHVAHLCILLVEAPFYHVGLKVTVHQNQAMLGASKACR
jgi:hypothetical protein